MLNIWQDDSHALEAVSDYLCSDSTSLIMPPESGAPVRH